MNQKIGVFDSGIGGYTILESLKTLLPNESFVYYADKKNNPYGEKSDEELLKITTNIVEYLQSENCKLIVIACNTATTKCMKKLRSLYPNIIFVGTVPAIKIACDCKFKNILVMATPATIESERTAELINDNKNLNQNIYLLPCPGLANAIELKDKSKIDQLLKSFLVPYKNKKIDSIVLGCTHYPFIKKEILSIIPDIDLIDGSDGVAREVKRQLQLNDLLNKDGKQEIIYIESNQLNIH